ncbi:MAG: alpha/beta fold hydrolase [Acetobacteraceae bacterium]
MADRRVPDPPPLPDLDFVGVDAAALGLAGPRLSFMEAGPRDGAAVLLLHGIAANSTGWRFLLRDLAASGRRAIAWNAPGYTLSDPFRAEAPTPEAYADALAALMDALGVARADVVGSSFGTLVGLCFAARHPGRVRRLALLGCSRGQRWKPPEERARMLAMREAMAAQGGLAMARERAGALVGPDPDPDPAVLAMVRRMLAATDGPALLQSARCSDGADTLDYAPAIAAPALLLCGEEDRVNPPAVSRAVAAALTAARLVLLPGIGHLPELECPATTGRLMLEHLSA